MEQQQAQRPQTESNEKNRLAFLDKPLAMLKNMNRNLRITLIAVVAVAVIAIVYLAASASQKQEYEILYAGMTDEDAAQVHQLLTDMGTDFKMQGTGTVLVPKGTKEDIKLTLLSEGFPQSGLDYSIFQNGSGLGATDSDKQAYLQFQTEQNIAYMIKRMEKVDNATVMVQLPKTSQFAVSSKNDTPAQASVLLELKNGETLTTSEAESIRGIVVRAVSTLQPEYVTIADSSMRVYRYTPDDGSGEDVGSQMEMTRQMQSLIQEQVYNLLAPVFGQENITVAANVVLDFDKKTTSSVTYTPPGDAENMGIIISMRQTAERVAAGDGASGVAGFDSNGSSPYYVEDVSQLDNSYMAYSQELNAELNEVREQVEQSRGQIQELSVSVMLDADETWDEALEEVRTLIATAVGVEEENVSLMRTPFLVNDQLEAMLAEQEQAALAEQEKLDNSVSLQYLLIGGAVVLLLVGLIIALSLSSRKKRLALEAEMQRRQEEWEAQLAEVEATAVEEKERALREMVSIPDNEGSPALQELQKLAEKDPQSIAQLLRNWLSDDYR